jgi:hypothetical protein
LENANHAISAALAKAGHLNERGVPFNQASIAKMIAASRQSGAEA